MGENGMIGYSYVQDKVHRAEPDNQKIARALINQIIAECNVARTKLQQGQDWCDAKEILEQLKDIQAQIFNVNCQMEALPSERELATCYEEDVELRSLFDNFWESY